MYLKEIRLKDADWIHLAQDRELQHRLVNTVMKLRAA
jgi:hypothetical protein